jgi:hypothetical protein
LRKHAFEKHPLGRILKGAPESDRLDREIERAMR